MKIKKYTISTYQYLKINPECVHESECQFCTRMDIDYVDEKNNIYITFGYEFIDEFYLFLAESERIQKLLQGKMCLPKNTKNLGLELNEIYQNNKHSHNILEYHWVSNSHKQVRPYYNSWLYNDKNKNIIFEITPFYPWFGATKKEHPEKISYKKWIKDYKPIVNVIIPEENIKKWIDQANELGEKYKLKFK